MLSWIYIVLAHWNNNPWVEVSHHSESEPTSHTTLNLSQPVTPLWIWANQSHHSEFEPTSHTTLNLSQPVTPLWIWANQSHHSDTLSWFWTNQSLFFLLNAKCNKYKFYSLWYDPKNTLNLNLTGMFLFNQNEMRILNKTYHTGFQWSLAEICSGIYIKILHSGTLLINN
jgi:hypothetical protein